MNNAPYLKAGIAVVVTTWENDGDNPFDRTLSGLTKDCALAVQRFCELFRSQHGWGKKGVGNSDVDQFDVDDVAEQLAQTDIDLIVNELNMTLEDLFSTIIGTWCDGEYIRVFETIKFLNVPMDIQEIELK